MKESVSQTECDEESRKMTLLKKYDIPIEQLDFRYVKSCANVKEIEIILKVLRSGEEGYFPDLIKFTEEKLRTLDPENCNLRIELPILKSQYLEKAQKEELLQDLSEWIANIQEDPSGNGDCRRTNELFSTAELMESELVVPIRGSGIVKVKDEENLVKKPNPDRIKSWEYDKWDKFDADAELTKLEVTDMQINEWEQLQKPKLKEEQKVVERLMKESQENTLTSPSRQPLISTIKDSHQKPLKHTHPATVRPNTDAASTSVDKPSFIEDVTNPIDPIKMESTHKPEPKNEGQKPKRRIKVMIEDVNVGGF